VAEELSLIRTADAPILCEKCGLDPMLGIYFLQLRFNLADPAVEEAL
jgi:hypothetical protein